MKPAPACIFCDEPVLASDVQTEIVSEGSLRPVHMECLCRSVFGSVAHINGRCRCFIPGSSEDDPPGMTRGSRSGREP